MKGPSLDAIRKFKEKQEQKRLEDEERKRQEKLSTIEFRAAQGDRRAKNVLTHFQKVKKDEEKQQQKIEHQKLARSEPQRQAASRYGRKPEKKKVVTNFEELMKIAQKNKNEVKKPTIKNEILSPQPKVLKTSQPVLAATPSVLPKPETSRTPVDPHRLSNRNVIGTNVKVVGDKCRKIDNLQSRSNTRVSGRPSMMSHQNPMRYAPNRSYNHYDVEYDDYEDEDEYEMDGFVVDEDEDEAKQELQKTLKTMFGYDKRKYDLREAELEREYRSIGNVSTFEDLEREERRSSRLAAAEDSLALKEEEERKRLKMMRKKGLK